MRNMTTDGLPSALVRLSDEDGQSVEELRARVKRLEEQQIADHALIARLRGREFEASLEKQVADGLKAATFKAAPDGRILTANAHALAMCGPVIEQGGNLFALVIDRLLRPSGIVSEDSAVRSIPKSYGQHVRDELVSSQQVSSLERRARRESDGFEMEHRFPPEQLIYESPNGPIRVLLGMSYVRDANGHPWIQLTLVDLDAVNRDDLTGLWRRGTFDNVLVRKVEERRRMLQKMGVAPPLAVGIADIDHFKPVNDTHGHLAGDDVLKAVARRIQRSAPRQTDMVARYGGEEFAFVLDADREESILVAHRMLTSVRNSDIAARGENGQIAIRRTVSIGLTLLQDEDDTPEQLLKRADMALYQAKGKTNTFLGIKLKGNGRNRVVIDGQVLPDPER